MQYIDEQKGRVNNRIPTTQYSVDQPWFNCAASSSIRCEKTEFLRVLRTFTLTRSVVSGTVDSTIRFTVVTTAAIYE